MNIVDSETHFMQFKLDELESQTELFKLDSHNCFTLPFLLTAFSLPNYEDVGALDLTLPKIISNHFQLGFLFQLVESSANSLFVYYDYAKDFGTGIDIHINLSNEPMNILKNAVSSQVRNDLRITIFSINEILTNYLMALKCERENFEFVTNNFSITCHGETLDHGFLSL